MLAVVVQAGGVTRHLLIEGFALSLRESYVPWRCRCSLANGVLLRSYLFGLPLVSSDVPRLSPWNWRCMPAIALESAHLL